MQDQPSSPAGSNTVNDLYSLAYDELRRLGAAVRRGDPFATVTTTALVNEAWIKLSSSPDLAVESDTHFKHIVVRAMRQVLVDSARRRRAIKRGGVMLTLDDDLPVDLGPAEYVLAVDSALTRLAEVNARAAQVVEAHFFGGLDWVETGKLVGISEATVHRDWRVARAWLAAELSDFS